MGEEALRLLDLVGVPDPARRMKAFRTSCPAACGDRVMIAIAVAGKPNLIMADGGPGPGRHRPGPGSRPDPRPPTSWYTVHPRHPRHRRGFAGVRPRPRHLRRPAGRRRAGCRKGAASAIHAYTVGLLNARLDLNLPIGHAIPSLPGEPPDPRAHPPGWRLAPTPLSGKIELHACGARSKAGRDQRRRVRLPGSRGRHGDRQPHRDGIVRTDARTRRDDARRANQRRRTACDMQQELLGKDKLHALRNVILDIAPGSRWRWSGSQWEVHPAAGRRRSAIEPESGTVDSPGGQPQMVFQDAGAYADPMADGR